MRKTLQWTAVALLLFLLGNPSRLHATTFYYDDQYFDCALNELAFCWTNCTPYGGCTGPREGMYWYHEATRCSDDVTVIQQWYQWNGSQWVAISPPSPGC